MLRTYCIAQGNLLIPCTNLYWRRIWKGTCVCITDLLYTWSKHSFLRQPCSNTIYFLLFYLFIYLLFYLFIILFIYLFLFIFYYFIFFNYFIYLFTYLLIYLFLLFRARTYRSSQARGQIRAPAANLRHSSRQCRILNPLSEAWVLMVTSQIRFCWATTGTPNVFNFFKKRICLP